MQVAPSTPPSTMPTWIISLLCAINFVISFDGGIMAGVPAELQYFIQTSQNSTDSGALFGLLSSSYVTAYAIAIPLFGYLSLTTKPFRIISIGLAVRVVAVAMSSVSISVNSVELLLAGRFLSGVGQASFQCIAPSFINNHGPSSLQTLWLGVYIMSATLGSTAGSIAASTLSSTNWGWESAFAMTGPTMAAILCVCAFGIPDEFDHLTADKGDEEESERLLAAKPASNNSSFLGAVYDVCNNAAFVWLSLGLASTAFSSSGMDVFGTLLLLGNGVFESETDANVTMGVQGVVALVIGTLLGGVVLDWTSRGAPHMRQYLAIRQLVLGFPVAVGAMMVALASIPDKTWFLVWSGVSGTVSGTIAPVLMTALFHSVLPSQRPIAVGLNSLAQHVLGDVPAPIIMGLIKEAWAPHCNSVLVNGIVSLNPQCHDDKDGLIMAMQFSLVWMVWAVACFGLALFFARRNMLKEKPTSV